ncbi:hypothetical protein F5X68DRAFT_10430 [Plectosphaerella plurivora]|uniref:Uncharacterized protein n=1 Tax=Plectosphaerella plurivora TaxID=936078 RepID=A0A9P9A8N4_9PEZI|nr:hypothetical protein F5X68DRAFT_10430 [Plectosphaerella plurivora]
MGGEDVKSSLAKRVWMSPSVLVLIHWAGDRKMSGRKEEKEKKETRQDRTGQDPGSGRKEIVVASRPVSPESIPLRDPHLPPTYCDHGMGQGSEANRSPVTTHSFWRGQCLGTGDFSFAQAPCVSTQHRWRTPPGKSLPGKQAGLERDRGRGGPRGPRWDGVGGAVMGGGPGLWERIPGPSWSVDEPGCQVRPAGWWWCLCRTEQEDRDRGWRATTQVLRHQGQGGRRGGDD